MGQVTLAVHPVTDGALDTAAHCRIQLLDDARIPGVFHIILQLHNEPGRTVCSVIVNVFRSQYIRNPAVIFRRFVRVLVFRKRQQNLLRRLKLAADQHRSRHCNELVPSPIFIEPRQSGVDPLPLLPRYQLIHGQADPVQRKLQLLVTAVQIHIILQKVVHPAYTLSLQRSRLPLRILNQQRSFFRGGGGRNKESSCCTVGLEDFPVHH
ncbi:hypothetical protein D3C75_454120 [compost metagenome]